MAGLRSYPAKFRRGWRSPRFGFIGQMAPMRADSVFFACPLLPNETVQGLSVGGRTMLYGTKSFVSPWYLDTVVFFCPLEILDPGYKATFFEDNPSAVNAATVDQNDMGVAIGQEYYIRQSLVEFVRHYINDDPTANNFVWPLMGRETLSQVLDLTDFDADASGDLDVDELATLQAEIMSEGQETYADILAQYGAPRGALRPEVFMWRRSKMYPVIRSPDDADESLNVGQVMWSQGYTLKKPRKVNVPGILLGVQCVRPRVVSGNRKAWTVGEMLGRQDWMVPPVEWERLIRPVSNRILDNVTGPPATPSEVTVNLANYYLYGESRAGSGTATQIVGNVSPLPTYLDPGFNTHDLTQAQAEAMLSTSYYLGCDLDVQLRIRSPIVEG